MMFDETKSWKELTQLCGENRFVPTFITHKNEVVKGSLLHITDDELTVFDGQNTIVITRRDIKKCEPHFDRKRDPSQVKVAPQEFIRCAATCPHKKSGCEAVCRGNVGVMVVTKRDIPIGGFLESFDSHSIRVNGHRLDIAQIEHIYVSTRSPVYDCPLNHFNTLPMPSNS